MEANPGTVELERFRAFRQAGVNRLSIGVQSFNEDHLRTLGRVHGADEAAKAAAAATDAGFARFNLDLMFALPGQTVAQAQADIAQALRLGARHVSHYQLTLEPGTAFHARPPTLPDEDTAAAMQAGCANQLAAGGLQRYEVSAWAYPGEACRHNLNYWQFGDYLAIGAGGHGKITDGTTGRIERYSKWHMPQQYMGVAGSDKALASRHVVPPEERPVEFAMNALRLPDGVPADYLPARTGLGMESFEAALASAEAEGLIERSDNRVRPTEQGLEFLNDTLGHFLAAD
jgi:oxygen-independent coproporphyrinogen-3 oxidase